MTFHILSEERLRGAAGLNIRALTYMIVYKYIVTSLRPSTERR